jgi:hypothetical protein
LAAELGEDFSSTATSGSSTAQLEDTAWPVKSTLDEDDQYAGQWLWRPNAVVNSDKVRIVKSNVASTGIITPDHTWTNSPANEVYHLLTGLPPVDGSSIDMRSLINEGLKRTIWPVEVTATPTVQNTRRSLADLGTWLRSETWILRVGLLHTGETRNQVDPYMRVVRGRVIRDGDTLYLDTYPQTFPASDTLYIEVLKPGYYHCRPSAGTFGSQAGLSLDTDECPIPEDWATAAALVVGWRRLRQRFARNPDLIRNRVEAAAWFSHLSRQYLNPLPRTFRTVPDHFGPYRGATTGGWGYKKIIVV